MIKKFSKKTPNENGEEKSAAAPSVEEHAAAQKESPGYRVRQNFPESSRPTRQLQLLLIGSKPLLRQKAAGVKYRIDSFRNGIVAKWRGIAWLGVAHNVAHKVVFLAASLFIAFLAAYNLLYTTATTVVFDGQELGVVANEEVADAARLSVEQSISDVVGYDYILSESLVSYFTGPTFRSNVVDETELEQAFTDSLDVVEHGYALYVDGQRIGATQTKGALETLLDQVSAPYQNENTVSVGFVEDVEIRECDLPVEDFTNLSDIALQLNSTKTKETTYTVQAGDCWSTIAEDQQIDSDELQRLNPGYDIDKLQIGDELLISAAVPYLTVRATQMEYYTEEIPFEIEYVDDDTMWEGDTETLSKGQYGVANTAARVVYEGTEEVERILVSTTVLTEPVTEIQARGTMERPTWAATGEFRWPCSGNITSSFGYRYIFGGTSFHSGIDIANKKGTDIVAADGGEVVYAGWMNGYGYLVQIDHNNGYVTYYGHNSSLLVEVGDKVYKGQHIAEMGSTGRTTGTHCHFEVRYNGDRLDPVDYLP